MAASGKGINQGRWQAKIDGDFVVFLIGARANSRRLVRVFRDLGGRRGMMRMLKDLSADPESGLLGYEMSTFGGLIVQYWRSFEDLERFANDQDNLHKPAWRDYWKRVGKDTRTGIWHESYLVRAGEYEAVYGNMPLFGLAKASQLVPAREGSRARDRVKQRTAG
jgi:hypothetical protein